MSIHIAPSAAAPIHSVTGARALAGQGLEGDRYSRRTGSYSSQQEPGRQVTLIEIEALEALKHDYKIELKPR